MSTGFVVSLTAVGLLAGLINSVVGSGSLLTFPVLLAAGYSPLVANVTNTVGLFFGTVSGTLGYRRELAGQGRRALRLGVCSVLGGLTGALLLLVLPAKVFGVIVPGLIVLAIVLVLAQPRLSRALAQRPQTTGLAAVLGGSVFLTGIYGGYFGAAQGVLLLGVLGILVSDNLQRLNGLKNLLAALVNGVAAGIFVFKAPVAWAPAVVVAVASALGAQVGARFGRRLPPAPLRYLIAGVGLLVVGKLILFPT